MKHENGYPKPKTSTLNPEPIPEIRNLQPCSSVALHTAGPFDSLKPSLRQKIDGPSWVALEVIWGFTIGAYRLPSPEPLNTKTRDPASDAKIETLKHETQDLLVIGGVLPVRCLTYPSLT